MTHDPLSQTLDSPRTTPDRAAAHPATHSASLRQPVDATTHAVDCGCRPCRHTRTLTLNHLQTHTGMNPVVDASLARAHLLNLAEAGMELQAVALQAGVGRRLVMSLGGPDASLAPTQLDRVISERILRVVSRGDGGDIIDGNGTRLRLRALVALGHDTATLASELGYTEQQVHLLLDGTCAVTRRVRAHVVNLFDRLSMTVPSAQPAERQAAAEQARAWARQRRWCPPLDLDEERIDEAGYRPRRSGTRSRTRGTAIDPAAVERRLAGDRTGRLTPEERAEVVARADAMGWTVADIELVTGITRTDRHRKPAAAAS